MYTVYVLLYTVYVLLYTVYIYHCTLYTGCYCSGSYLDRQIAHLPPHQGDGWAPLNNYRSMLIYDDDTRSIASTSVSRPRGRRAGE